MTLYEKQAKYCKDNKYPLFAFKKCCNCHISLEEGLTMRYGEDAVRIAENTLITGCPNCCRTWCD